MATVEQGDAVVLDIVSDASTVSMFLHQTFGEVRVQGERGRIKKGKKLQWWRGR